MKKNIFNRIKNTAFVSISALIAAAALSCNVGLGESVDTKDPSVTINYPPRDVIIRDSFVLAGTFNDDKDVASVKVNLVKIDGNETVLKDVEASLDKTKDTWQIELNKYDTENSAFYNGWEFSDGEYRVSAIATDASGRKSAEYSQNIKIDNTAPLFIISSPGRC